MYQGNLPAILKELDAIFPYWYDRDWRKLDAPSDASRPLEISHEGRSVRATVLDYIRSELAGDESLQPKVVALAERLVAEVEP